MTTPQPDPVKGPTPEPLKPHEASETAVQKDVADWRKNFEKQARGAKAAPGPEGDPEKGRYQELRLIRSWMDVAPFITELYSRNGADIRVTFPDPRDEHNGDAAKAALLKVEQHNIRAFLRDFHGKPLEAISGELVKRMESAASFSAFRADKATDPAISAEQWVKYNLAAISLDETKNRNIHITDIISLQQPENSREFLGKREILASLNESQKKGITVIFELPQREDRILGRVASALQEVKDLQLIGEARVWVVNQEQFGQVAAAEKANTECGPVASYTLEEFINKYKGFDDSTGGDTLRLGAEVQKALQKTRAQEREELERQKAALIQERDQLKAEIDADDKAATETNEALEKIKAKLASHSDRLREEQDKLSQATQKERDELQRELENARREFGERLREELKKLRAESAGAISAKEADSGRSQRELGEGWRRKQADAEQRLNNKKTDLEQQVGAVDRELASAKQALKKEFEEQLATLQRTLDTDVAALRESQRLGEETIRQKFAGEVDRRSQDIESRIAEIETRRDAELADINKRLEAEKRTLEDEQKRLEDENTKRLERKAALARVSGELDAHSDKLRSLYRKEHEAAITAAASAEPGKVLDEAQPGDLSFQTNAG